MVDKAYEIAGKMLALSELFLELRVIDRDRFTSRHLKLRTEAEELGILGEVTEVITEYYLEDFDVQYPEVSTGEETNDNA